MHGKKLAGSSAAALAVVLLSGCGAEEDAPEAAPPPTSSPAASPVSSPAEDTSQDDEAACTAFGDVMTILENADIGLRDGRMETQEQQGWYRLATRVLDGLPSSGDGAVSEAIAELRAVAPAVPRGAAETVDIGSQEWNSAVDALATACLDVGVELGMEIFTGG